MSEPRLGGATLRLSREASVRRSGSGHAPCSYRLQLGVAPALYWKEHGYRSGGSARLRSATVALVLAGLTGCATQGSYVSPSLPAPPAWTQDESRAERSTTTQAGDDWWRVLHDDAINALTDAALADSPSIAQAMSRVDEARAQVQGVSAQRVPALTANAGVTRARSLDTDSVTGGTSLTTQRSVGVGLSWELDLFGRVRNSVQASERRVEAREADARAARLLLTSEIGDLVLAARACELSAVVLENEIASREKTLALTRRRLETGFVAPVEEARALSGLATTRHMLAERQETCARNINALVAATGQPRTLVRGLVASRAVTASSSRPLDTVADVPMAPPFQLRLPAIVLAAHPSVVAAEREAAAAWADIAVARAERLPRLDLAAALSGQWLSAAGQSISETVWSIGPALSGSVFDGGRGAAAVSAAEARYRGAVANLQAAVRQAAQEVEDALAGTASAEHRRQSTGDAVVAAQRVFDAIEARWNVGAADLFEVEDARRQLATARENAITAAYDGGRMWVALVRATGHDGVAHAQGSAQ